jgi:prepilin-type N-terminal cleavage/methylation domain-containing protein
LNSQPAISPPASLGISGYTLFELIVVIALISMTMVFAVPKVRQTIFMDNQRQIALWLTSEVVQLKKKSLLQKQTQILHIDIDQNRHWVTTAGMPSDMQLKAEESSTAFPGGVNVIDIEFPIEGKISSGKALIHFYPQGYSDHAIIHLRVDDQTNLSFHIEPFLSTVPIYEDVVGFGE